MMNDSNTPSAAPVAMTILNTQTFRVQMLAKLTGLGMDTLGKGLNAEPKPTAKVVLSAAQQTLLNAVAADILRLKANAAMREAALRDAIDAQALTIAQLREENNELLCTKLVLEHIVAMQRPPAAKPQDFTQHPDFRVLRVGQALVHLADELIEFVQSPSKDEASDLAFGLGRLLGALCKRKYVAVWGDGLHIAKCNERMVRYGHFRSRRHLAA